MAGRVVHLEPEAHDKLKRLAKETGRSMGDLVEQLINEAVAGVVRIAPVATLEPVPKKKLSDPPPPPQVDTDEALRRPPFWKARQGRTSQEQQQTQTQTEETPL